jgi:4-amino-4-deoxy-L-arabinose transferase-like glycosyltransferase
MSTRELIRLLVWLLVMALVIWVVYLVLGMLPLPYPVGLIACVVLAVVFLLVILRHTGLLD